jgi:hypothetical protein
MENKQITLVQFPYKDISLSPFCLKLETYLKAANIPYTNKFEQRPSSGKAKFPMALIDGEKIEDSSFIIDRLNKDLPLTNIDKDLTDPERALTIACQRLLEDSLNNIMIYYRWQNQAGWENFKEKVFRSLAWPIKWVVPEILRRQVIGRLHAQGTGRFTHEELLVITEKNLFALSTLLGDKKYFFSDSQLHLLDIICFSVLTELSTVINKDIQDLLAKFPNLIELQKSVYNLYWKKEDSKQ